MLDSASQRACGDVVRGAGCLSKPTLRCYGAHVHTARLRWWIASVKISFVDYQGAFVPHKPDPELGGAILYVVRLNYFGKLMRLDQERLIQLNPHAQKKAPVFYVGQTALMASQRYENHLNGYKSSRWVRRYGQALIRVDEWKPDFGVAIPKKTIRTAWELARRSNDDPIEREKALTELLRAQGFFVISH